MLFGQLLREKSSICLSQKVSIVPQQRVAPQVAFSGKTRRLVDQQRLVRAVAEQNQEVKEVKEAGKFISSTPIPAFIPREVSLRTLSVGKTQG